MAGASVAEAAVASTRCEGSSEAAASSGALRREQTPQGRSGGSAWPRHTTAKLTPGAFSFAPAPPGGRTAPPGTRLDRGRATGRRSAGPTRHGNKGARTLPLTWAGQLATLPPPAHWHAQRQWDANEAGERGRGGEGNQRRPSTPTPSAGPPAAAARSRFECPRRPTMSPPGSRGTGGPPQG
jgi:hypothetical protein